MFLLRSSRGLSPRCRICRIGHARRRRLPPCLPAPSDGLPAMRRESFRCRSRSTRVRATWRYPTTSMLSRAQAADPAAGHRSWSCSPRTASPPGSCASSDLATRAPMIILGGPRETPASTDALRALKVVGPESLPAQGYVLAAGHDNRGRSRIVAPRCGRHRHLLRGPVAAPAARSKRLPGNRRRRARSATGRDTRSVADGVLLRTGLVAGGPALADRVPGAAQDEPVLLRTGGRPAHRFELALVVRRRRNWPG